VGRRCDKKKDGKEIKKMGTRVSGKRDTRKALHKRKKELRCICRDERDTEDKT